MSILRMRGLELLQLSIPFCLKEVNSRESNGVCSISFLAAMVLLAISKGTMIQGRIL